MMIDKYIDIQYKVLPPDVECPKASNECENRSAKILAYIVSDANPRPQWRTGLDEGTVGTQSRWGSLRTLYTVTDISQSRIWVLQVVRSPPETTGLNGIWPPV
jgi:hypothetical protein